MAAAVAGTGIEVRAVARNVRISPQKVRLVLKTIKGKPVREAEAILRYLPHKAAGPIGKLLKSAVANADNNFELDPEDLVVWNTAADGATEIHGALPINTDGGLIANGEPIGASGLRQIHELVRQLRGEAGDRQVPGAPKVGFAQLYGAPGTAAATVLTR